MHGANEDGAGLGDRELDEATVERAVSTDPAWSGQLDEVFWGQNSTSGGSSETDENEPMAMPTGWPSLVPVMIVTPVGKCPRTLR